MIPPPITSGFLLCDIIIVEEHTRKVSIIGQFERWRALQFPTIPRPYSAYARLVDASGDGAISLSITDMTGGQEVFRMEGRIRFPSRIHPVPVILHINGCSFPHPGWYEIKLLIDGQEIAERLLEVYEGKA